MGLDSLLLAAMLLPGQPAAGGIDRHDVIFDQPAEDPRDSVPLGNGEVGLNAWVDPAGDLLCYLARTDSWDDHARLLKIGRLRFHLDPAPSMTPFRQRLSLADATLVATCGVGDGAVEFRLWADANRPLVHCTVTSARPVAVTCAIELWRTAPVTLPSIEVSDIMVDRSQPGGQREPTVVAPDIVVGGLADRIGWVHRNETSVGPALTMGLQGLDGLLGADPLLHRTFGGLVAAEGGRRLDDTHLRSPSATAHHFTIAVHTAAPATVDHWLAESERLLADAAAAGFDADRAAHEAWWSEFWNRSWIHVTAPSTTVPPALPENRYPIRIGMDQAERNRYSGELGRVSLLGRALSAAEVSTLAGRRRDEALPAGGNVLFSEVGGGPRAVPGSEAWTFPQGLTVEAWVAPGDLPNGGARIVDRITPGQSDGFLFDTYPHNSLRLIVGERTYALRDKLPPGEWHHVAATMPAGAGSLGLFLDGQRVAGEMIDGLDDGAVVSRGYALQRFVNACAGRGRYPIKFNGSIFTTPWPGAPGDADYRRWGPGYWWQNTRLPYLSMAASGDLDLTEPLFRVYIDELLPVCRERTRRYFGHGGAYYPECIYFWGACFSETYGWQPRSEREDPLQTSGWHKWEWVGGLELAWLALDRWEHGQDEAFLRTRTLPLADAVVTFFGEHYETGDDGKLVMHPSQSLETWWDCDAPMPEVAGLHAVLGRLLALPASLTTAEQRARWADLLGKLPDLPLREVGGVKMLAPAARFADKRNIENGELYAVFPFRLVSFEKETAELGRQALAHRWDKGHRGWRQDDLFMTHLGLADEARAYLVARARSRCPDCRFPAFWGPNFDWVPDQDHGGVLLRTLQTMLMQTEGRRIFLLPAWPNDWDAEFRLHAPYRTTLTGRIVGGMLIDLEVTPAERRGDVVIVGRPPGL